MTSSLVSGNLLTVYQRIIVKSFWETSSYQGHAKLRTEPNKRFMWEGQKVIYRRQLLRPQSFLPSTVASQIHVRSPPQFVCLFNRLSIHRFMYLIRTVNRGYYGTNKNQLPVSSLTPLEMLKNAPMSKCDRLIYLSIRSIGLMK